MFVLFPVCDKDKHILNITTKKGSDCFSFLSHNVSQLKALDTFGNCQTLVFLLGVSQHMHKIKNL